MTCLPTSEKLCASPLTPVVTITATDAHPLDNTEAMNLHLVEIAATVAPGAHAVLLVDQAGWHLSTGLVVPPNITIMALPPKCPELNPVDGCSCVTTGCLRSTG